MKVLVFDTETTGLPSERNASYMEVHKWPHIVQLSFALYDLEERKLKGTYDYIIRLPDDIPISTESQNVHGITHSLCRRKGVPIQLALEEFGKCLVTADVIVAHNLSFDKRVILAACRREGVPQYFFGEGKSKSEFCTMLRTKDIPVVVAKNSRGEEYNKYPTLTELHQFLFNGDIPKGIHDAMADILICLRCYVKFSHGFDITSETGILPRLYNLYCF